MNIILSIVTLFVFMVVPSKIWGQDCTADDGTEGVELWGECYSIENTTEILLPSSGLTGEIPESIGSLNNLNSLVLYNNQLIGILPESITNLINLTWLNLYNNQLTGEIPQDIGNLTNLTTLDLGFNQFIGELPESLGDLTNLNHLWLFNNQLNGEIPETICDVYQNLEHFFIYNNQLCPPYPDCLTEEDVGYQDTTNCSSCDEGYTEILDIPESVTVLDNSNCFYQSDLEVLQEFIDNSQDGDNPPSSFLLPIELGEQVWEDGRLTEFKCSTLWPTYLDYELSGDIPEG